MNALLPRFWSLGRVNPTNNVTPVAWRCHPPGGGEQAGRLEFPPAFAIEVRPFAGGLSRRELAGVPVVIETFDEAVDPSEAQRLTNRVLVRDRLHSRVVLVEHEPDPWARRMVLSQPRAPLLAAPNV